MDFGPGEIIEGVLCSEPDPSKKQQYVSARVFVINSHDELSVKDAYHFIGIIPLGVSSKINNLPFPTRP